MELAKLDINNTPHLGIFVALGKDFAIVPNLVSENECNVIKNILGVDCIKYNIAGSQMNGIMVKLYNNKLLLSKIASKEDINFYEKLGFEVLVLDHYFAVGNLIATNQKEVLVSKEFDSKTIKKIDEFLGINTLKFQISDLIAIGSCLVANKGGFAVTPKASSTDIKKLEKIFGVKGNIATVNYGDGFIANGMLVNDNGILVGTKTTGYELIRINDIFYN